jgi:hypothetical protein
VAWTTPATWTSGQVPTAANFNTHIRDNFNTLAPAVCTTAGDTFYATGNKALTRLAIGSPYQVLTMNAGQTATTWGEGYIPLDVITQDAEILNNAAEATIYTSPNIGSNLLGTTNTIKLEWVLSYLNNTGATQDLTVKIKLDSTVLFTVINDASHVTSVTRRATVFHYMLLQNQSASSQKHFLSSQATAATGAITSVGGAQSAIMNYTTTAVDLSTGIHNIIMTVEHGSANSTQSLIIRHSGLWLTRAV